MQTRDQKYAMDIYNRVKSVKETNPKDFCDSYGSMAHKLPILIRTAGLAQALAFVEARAEGQKSGALKRLMSDLAETLHKSGTLTEVARTSPLSEYMFLTQQTMAALLWYKRFAQSVLDVQASNEGEKSNEYTPSQP